MEGKHKSIIHFQKIKKEEKRSKKEVRSLSLHFSSCAQNIALYSQKYFT